MVGAGGSHTVALSEAGHVFTWGWGVSGQLGHNDTSAQRAPRQVEAVFFGGKKVVFVHQQNFALRGRQGLLSRQRRHHTDF